MEKQPSVTLQRELRYYASVPKLLLLLLLSGGVAAIGWWAWTTHTFSGVLAGAPLLGVGGIGAVTCLIWLFVAIGVRKPLLTINNIGFITSLPLRPSRGAIFRWDEIKGIGIRYQRLRRRTVVIMRVYYLALDICDEVDVDGLDASPTQSNSLKSSFPWLTDAALIATLGIHFLFDTRKRRAQMLERIKTTFAPEIIQYNIWVDDIERAL